MRLLVSNGKPILEVNVQIEGHAAFGASLSNAVLGQNHAEPRGLFIAVLSQLVK